MANLAAVRSTECFTSLLVSRNGDPVKFKVPVKSAKELISVSIGASPNEGGYILCATGPNNAEWKKYITDGNVPTKEETKAGTYNVPSFTIDPQGRLSNLTSLAQPWTHWLPRADDNAKILKTSCLARKIQDLAEIHFNMKLLVSSNEFSLSNLPYQGHNQSFVAILKLPSQTLLTSHAKLNEDVITFSIPHEINNTEVELLAQIRFNFLN